MKAGGITESERYLSRLCHMTFLSPWSFSNVFKRPGQELCDVLIIFGNDVIIFSDKSCALQETDNISIGWSRWYRDAVVRSEKQLRGAERWLGMCSDQVFLDSACMQCLPIALPPAATRRIHLIAVSSGSRGACIRYFGGGSGSLRISTSCFPIAGPSTFLNLFVTGYIEPEKKYVHVFDDVTLDIILGELDTAADFCAYLHKREELSRSLDFLNAGGEEELLALYLQTLNEMGKHDFFERCPQINGLSVEEGFWEARLEHPRYLAKKRADEISYLWDSLIEGYAAHTFPRPDGSTGPPDERLLRAMASLSRLERRVVSQGLRDLLTQKPLSGIRFKGVAQGRGSRTGIAFLLLPKPSQATSDEEYFLMRHDLLGAYCMAMKLQWRALEEVVGIGLAPLNTPLEDCHEVLYQDLSNWTQEDEEKACEDKNRLGLLTRATMTPFRENEYPEVSSAAAVTHASAPGRGNRS